MSGPEKLRKFIGARGLTQDEFASQAGVPSPQVSMWLSGRRRPGLQSALKLEAATGGIVRASDWLVSRAA